MQTFRLAIKRAFIAAPVVPKIPSKGTSLLQTTSFETPIVEIGWGVWASDDADKNKQRIPAKLLVGRPPCNELLSYCIIKPLIIMINDAFFGTSMYSASIIWRIHGDGNSAILELWDAWILEYRYGLRELRNSNILKSRSPRTDCEKSRILKIANELWKSRNSKLVKYRNPRVSERTLEIPWFRNRGFSIRTPERISELSKAWNRPRKYWDSVILETVISGFWESRS